MLQVEIEIPGERRAGAYRNFDAIIRICKARGARVILVGMLSLPKNGPNYIVGFNNIYPILAQAAAPATIETQCGKSATPRLCYEGSALRSCVAQQAAASKRRPPAANSGGSFAARLSVS